MKAIFRGIGWAVSAATTAVMGFVFYIIGQIVVTAIIFAILLLLFAIVAGYLG